MFRYLALGVTALAIVLSTACSSTTNITGVDLPTRDVANAQPPSTGNDIMNAQPPSTGNDIMRSTSNAQPPSTGNDIMNSPPPPRP